MPAAKSAVQHQKRCPRGQANPCRQASCAIKKTEQSGRQRYRTALFFMLPFSSFRIPVTKNKAARNRQRSQKKQAFRNTEFRTGSSDAASSVQHHHSSDPCGNRTRNLQLRRLSLYPIELKGRICNLNRRAQAGAARTEMHPPETAQTHAAGTSGHRAAGYSRTALS